MCLAIPGRIEEVFEKEGLKMAKINFGGIRKPTCLEYTPQARSGDYVLVHVGFAISVIDEEEAKRQFELLKETDDFSELAANSETEI